MAWITVLPCFLLGLAISVTSQKENLNTDVELGKAVTLLCPKPTDGYYSRQWYRGYLSVVDGNLLMFDQFAEGIPPTKSPTVRTGITCSTEFELTIADAKFEDDGNYTCFTTKKKPQGSVERTYDAAAVYITPHIVPDQIDDKTLKEGDQLKLSCSIDRIYPEIDPSAFTMTWGLNKTGSVLIGGGVNQPFQYKVEMSKVLTFSDDGLNVTCDVKPARGPTTVKPGIIPLHVLHKPNGNPSVEIENRKPNQRETVAFECSATAADLVANPPVSKAQWIKDNLILNWTDFSPIIHKTNLSDSGLYSCQLGNDLGFSDRSKVVNFEVSANYGPYGSVILSINDTTTRLNLTVAFNCDVANVLAYPNVDSVTWTKNGDRLDDWEDAFTRVLVARGSDNGTYGCKVANGIGNGLPSKSVAFAVSAFYKPVGQPGLKFQPNVTEGELVTFTCDSGTVDANPKEEADWFHNGLPVIDRWTSSLVQTIKVAISDSGSYSCRIKNFLGESHVSLSKRLLVSQEPDEGQPAASDTGAIVGGIVGGLVFIAIITTIVIVILVKKRAAKSDHNPPMTSARSERGYSNPASPHSDDPTALPSSVPSPSQLSSTNRAKGEVYENVNNPWLQSRAGNGNERPQLDYSDDDYATVIKKKPKPKTEANVTYAELQLRVPLPGASYQITQPTYNEEMTQYAHIDFSRTNN